MYDQVRTNIAKISELTVRFLRGLNVA